MPIQIDLGRTTSDVGNATKKAQGPAVGIDLGTTNSLVAYRAPGAAAQVLSGEGGERLLPSVVAVDADGRVTDVGSRAAELRSTQPRQVLYSVKRLMGRTLKDLGDEVARIPYELVDDPASAQVQVRVGQRNLSPVEISSHILRALRKRADLAMAAPANGQSAKPIERAVITVPAYFDDAQRSATKAAGRVAGLEVMRVLNEPTAAALAYGWSNERPGTVAVYDLGGGTFDVSILRIEENVFEVLSTAGDTQLGGDDLDLALAQFVLDKLAATDAALRARIQDENERRQVYALALSQAESVKRQLSEKDEATFAFELHSVRVTRAEAEALWLPLVQRSLDACTQAVADSRLALPEISDVLLVGGSTRVPLVRREVERYFGRAPNTSLNPDEAVALGAAIQADALANAQDTDRLLLDIIPLSLGIETMGGAVSKLIHRNSTLPAEARELYTNHAENQTAFDIHVVQGERELVRDCRSLARFKLRGLTPAPPGFHRVEVLFRIDANGILNVRARDLRSHKAHEVEVRPSFGVDEDELYRLLEASEEHAAQDMHDRQWVDLRIEADTVLRAAHKAVAQAGHLVDGDKLTRIRASLEKVEAAYNGQSPDALQAAMTAFNDESLELAEKQVNLALGQALEGTKVGKL